MVLPLTVFADGVDQTDSVEAVANNANGDVTKNVGNINVTIQNDPMSVAGIRALARDGKTATVNAKDVNVDVSVGSIYLYGIDAIAGNSKDNVSGRVFITTGNVVSRDQGVSAWSQIKDSVVSIITNGNIQAVGATGWGAVVSTRKGGTSNIVVNGNVDGQAVGIYVSSFYEGERGTVNVDVYGDVTANDESKGKGLSYSGTSDTSDVLVTGTIAGKYGVCTRTYDANSYNPAMGDNKLTVWQIAAPDGYAIVKQTASAEDEKSYAVDDDFAGKINYIIKHDENIVPKKADGKELDKSHDYYVAKEGDKVIVDTAFDGVFIEKAYNNGIEITDTDADGNYYVIVPRGGAVDLTIDADLCPANPGKREPGICGCDVPDTDTDGDGTADCVDVCPNDPRNALEMPQDGCFINGSDVPEAYDPNVPVVEDHFATPATKPLPPFVLRDGNAATVYFERFAGGMIGKKPATAKYEVTIKTKNKKTVTTKKFVQALKKNLRKLKIKKGTTVTVQYRMVLTKKIGKKIVTKRSKMSKAVKLVFQDLK